MNSENAGGDAPSTSSRRPDDLSVVRFDASPHLPGDTGTYVLMDPEGRPVATVWGRQRCCQYLPGRDDPVTETGSDDPEAVARRFAASGKLLAACERLMKAWRDHADDSVNDFMDAMEFGVMPMVDEAIDMSNGEGVWE